MVGSEARIFALLRFAMPARQVSGGAPEWGFRNISRLPTHEDAIVRYSVLGGIGDRWGGHIGWNGLYMKKPPEHLLRAAFFGSPNDFMFRRCTVPAGNTDLSRKVGRSFF